MVVKRTVATTVACCVFLPSTKTITVKVIVHILVDGKKTQHATVVATVRFTTMTYSRSEDKTVWKNPILLRILAVIGRYGPRLMIVVLSVTQNNL